MAMQKSQKEKENLGKINEEYFSSRANLNKVVLLVDSRHKPNQDDVIMYEYIRHFGIPCLVVGTKLDKLKRNEVKRNEKMIRETLGMIPEDQIILYSSLTRENRDKVLEAVFSDLTIEQEL